jgi:pimeloyl-ACP methyl ester carboxylesterase
MPHQTFTVPVRGGDLTVGAWGPEGGACLIAIHGITASHLTWQLVADALPGVRIVAPDLRGRGRSHALPPPYGMQQHADDVEAVVAALGIERAVVVGHSMGAFVAAVFAAQHPHRVAGLVLVDGGVPFALAPGADRAATIASTLGPSLARLSRTFSSLDEYRAFWRAHPAFAHAWSPSVERYIEYDLVGDRAATPLAAVAQDSAELFGSPTVDAALAHLPAGTTLLVAPRGLLDQVPGLYAPTALDAWRGRLRVVTVPGVNHYTIVLAEPGARAVAEGCGVTLPRASAATR